MKIEINAKTVGRKALELLFSPVIAAGYLYALGETYIHVGRRAGFGHVKALYFDEAAQAKLRQAAIEHAQRMFPGAKVRAEGDHVIVERPDDDPDQSPAFIQANKLH